MTLAHYKKFRFIWLCIMASLIALLLVVNVPAVLAGDFVLDWSSIGFVEGTSSLQTFTNVNNSGVDMTTEFRVLNAAFQDIGIYIPGSGPLNQGIPKPDGSALAIRDISESDYPGADVGYVFTKITFSDGITIDSLWTESFYHWAAQDIRKNLAIQAFDAAGNGLAPISWTIYGASTLIVEPHPINGEPWLRSTFPDNQNVFTGAEAITYGDQLIRELHWYSWGYAADDSLSHLLGSTYLGDFQFSRTPTAISLVSLGAEGKADALDIVLLALLVMGLATLVVVRLRLLKTD